MTARVTDTTATKRLPLLALLAGNAISMVGNVLSMIAIPWFVLETTGSASKTGLTAFFTVLPAVLAAFLGGTIVDRLGYKRASVVSDVSSGLTAAAIPLLYLTVGLQLWQLLALVFLGALLDAPGNTARVSLMPDVAVLAGTRLERVNAAAQGIQRGSFLLGAPLAGALIAWLGPSQVLWLNAASFGVSAAMVAFLVPSGPPRPLDEHRASYMADLLEGLRFVRRDRLVLAIVGSVMVTNFLDSPLFSVLMPVYAQEVYGSVVPLGLLFGAFGGGALLGTILYGAVGHRLPRRATFVGAFILVGLPFWVFATLPSLPVAIAANVFAGIAAGPINPLITTVSQERIPKEMRGRVFGTITAAAYIAIPLGVLLAGYLVEWLGVRAVLLGIAACYLATTLSLLLNPALHAMDDHRSFTEPAPNGT